MFPSQSTSSNGATAVAPVSDGLQRTKMPQRKTATSQRRQRSIQTSSLERHAPSAVRARGPTSPYFFLSQSTAPLSQLAFSPIVIVAQGSPVAVIVAIVGIPPIFNSSGYTRLQYISNLPISRSSTCQRNLPRIGIYNITGQGRPRRRDDRTNSPCPSLGRTSETLPSVANLPDVIEDVLGHPESSNPSKSNVSYERFVALWEEHQHEG